MIRLCAVGELPRIHLLGEDIKRKNAIPTKMNKGQVMSMPTHKDSLVTLPSTVRMRNPK
ncbi:MAG: hypothetical protein XU12_C0001G0216 [Deltaproteobacteria bacterium CSP1-8]|nr:MAG: hypothetical protein XU12_C0001G0216 [Deltaproteobacteria bacterium CSP1-8]